MSATEKMKTGTRERGITFCAPMVRAILDGRKTQTRRVMKPQPTDWTTTAQGALWPSVERRGLVALRPCRYGMPGDRLYVKERWCEDYTGETIHYQADGGESPGPAGFWRSSRFMPKWAARIWLEVTGVRAERLQDITDDDAMAEGVIRCDEGPLAPLFFPTDTECNDGTNLGYDNPRTAFAALWDSLHAKDFPWAANPFVSAISFRMVK